MYLECATRGEAQISQLIAQFNALHSNYDDMNFSAPHLALISARTLVIHGDQDNFFPIDIAQAICSAIADASLWLIPGGAHVPIYDEQIPFVETTLAFLKGQAFLNSEGVC